MSKRSYLVALVFLILAAVPAVAGTIVGIDVQTNSATLPYGRWSATVGPWASIGVTAPGASNNAFLDPTASLSIPSGSYLLFFGYEDHFANGALQAGQINPLTLTVTYADTTTLSATFSSNVLTSPSIWSRTGGSSLLVIGSSGITNVDRNGEFNAGQYGSNGVNDIVLEFSDTGSFNSGSGVPEPATLGTTSLAFCAALYLKRRLLR